MKKKTILFTLMFALALQLTFAENAKRPNIIWLMAEDISLDLECYGMPAVKTPNLNSLAQRGMMFKNCFVTSPICSPSRSAMMTGTYQVKINAHNHRSNRDVALPEPYKPFTYWLRKAGYTCILGNSDVMGKGRKIDCNFKTQALGEWDGKTNFGLFDKYDEFLPEDQPFFAQIQLLATHRGDWWSEVRAKSEHPVDPQKVVLPPQYADNPAIRLDWAKYLDQIEYIDNEVGMIEKDLEQKGMADNTIIIFIGDNGRCNILGKGYLHDPGLRIPLIIYQPKDATVFKNKQIINDVISSTDITATILDIAGCKIPDYMTGESFLNKNFDRKESYGARDLWDEIAEKSRSVYTERWAYIRNDKPEIPYDAHQTYLEFYRPAVHVMRTLNKEDELNEDQKFFFAPSKPKEELYDLQNDPYQLNNLASDAKYAEVLKELRDKTVSHDKKMMPVSDIYHPQHPVSVDVFQFVKENYPEAYKQMREGVEIGFSKYVTLYKEQLKKK